MQRVIATGLLFAVLGAACQQKAEVASGGPAERMAPSAPAAAPVATGKSNADAAASEAGLRRHIALRHELHLQTQADAVEATWRRAHDACVAAGCEILGSSLARDDARHPAQARLDLRVPPDKLAAFLQQVSAMGSVGLHSQTAEDKTDEVIDTEARLKNLGEFRDNLRRLMGTQAAKLKDLIELERELVRVQSELDSLASRRKALAQLTDKVQVSVRITAQPTVLEEGVWSPVTEAVTGAGRLLGRSLGVAISFVVAALPWALLLAATVWGVRALWRRRRRSG